jgi:Ni/Co efflux regulator RcnB
VAQAREHGLFVLVERAVGLARQLGQPARVGLQPLLLAQRLFLAGLKRGLLDLDRLVLEHLAAALVLAPIARSDSSAASTSRKATEGLRHRDTDRHRGPHGGPRDRGVSGGRASPCGSCCPWMFAMNGASSRNTPTGTSAPLTVALPFPEACTSRRTTISSSSAGSPWRSNACARVAALDQRLHHREVFARADEIRRRARAEQQPERVDQDRLSRSRFAREEREARPELQLHAVNECDVLYFQQLEHRRPRPAPLRTLLRL